MWLGNKESKLVFHFLKMCYITIIDGSNGGIKLHSQASLSPSQPLDFYLAYKYKLKFRGKTCKFCNSKRKHALFKNIL